MQIKILQVMKDSIDLKSLREDTLLLLTSELKRSNSSIWYEQVVEEQSTLLITY